MDFFISNIKFINDYFTEKFKDKALAGGYLAINKNTLEDIPFIEVLVYGRQILMGMMLNYLMKKINILKRIAC